MLECAGEATGKQRRTLISALELHAEACRTKEVRARLVSGAAALQKKLGDRPPEDAEGELELEGLDP